MAGLLDTKAGAVDDLGGCREDLDRDVDITRQMMTPTIVAMTTAPTTAPMMMPRNVRSSDEPENNAEKHHVRRNTRKADNVVH